MDRVIELRDPLELDQLPSYSPLADVEGTGLRELYKQLVWRTIKDLEDVCQCKDRGDQRTHVINRVHAICWIIVNGPLDNGFARAMMILGYGTKRGRQQILEHLDRVLPKPRRVKLSEGIEKQRLLAGELCADYRSGRSNRSGKGVPVVQRLLAEAHSAMELAAGASYACSQESPNGCIVVGRCVAYALGLNDTPWTDILRIEERGRC